MTQLRVLIVDDERIVADSLCIIFQKCGYSVRVAYGASDGIACAREFSPELLLTDISMPGMSGLIMASLIARELPACRVLMLTGDYRALDEAGIVGRAIFSRHSLLTKPIHPETLIRAAHQLLNYDHAGLSASLPLQ